MLGRERLKGRSGSYSIPEEGRTQWAGQRILMLSSWMFIKQSGPIITFDKHILKLTKNYVSAKQVTTMTQSSFGGW